MRAFCVFSLVAKLEYYDCIEQTLTELMVGPRNWGCCKTDSRVSCLMHSVLTY